jgi:hypothetical protein
MDGGWIHVVSRYSTAADAAVSSYLLSSYAFKQISRVFALTESRYLKHCLTGF